MIKDMTKGSVVRQILMFTLPLLLGNLFQQFYNMVDSIIVGKFIGTNALAAVGSTGSINFLIIGFVLGISSGFCIPVSQYFGAMDFNRLRKTIANMIYLSLVITLVLTTVTLLYTRDILILMQTPEEILDDAYDYIIIIFGGMAATMFYNILAGILRALGDSRSPLIFLIISALSNVVLDLLFIIVIPMGVAGAGYATVLAQFISGCLCLAYIIHKREDLKISLKKEDFRPSGYLMRRLLYLGLPMAFQFSITAIGGIILQSAVNTLGSDSIAAVTAGTKTQQIVTQPMESLGITMATFGGQNRGAGKIDRVNEGVNRCLLLSLIYSVFAGLFMWFFGKQMALLFVNADETVVIDQITHLYRVGAVFYPVLGFLFVYRNTVQGLGYGVPAMLAGVFELFARAFIAITFVSKIGFDAACYASPFAWIMADILLIPVYYIVIHKLKRQLRDHPQVSIS
ncbi:MAG: MATE family efflux transporter [Eubacteriales bacterium]